MQTSIPSSRRSWSVFAEAPVLAAALLCAACGQKPAAIRISPARETFYGVGKRAVIMVEVVDKSGKPILGSAVTWKSSKPTVAAVEGTGLVKSVAPGRAIMTATVDNLSATCAVEVIDLASILVLPNRVTLVGPKGTQIAFVAQLKDSHDKAVSLKPKWSSSEPSVATIDANGLATGVSEGRTAIAASLGDFVSAGDLHVLFRPVAVFEAAPPTLILKLGETQRITATARDSTGHVIDDPATTWTSSDSKAATCVNGAVTGIAPGAATITAACGGHTAEVSVIVN